VVEFHNEFHDANYGAINQAGRDLNITNVSSLEALKAAGEVRAGLDSAELPADLRHTAHDQLDAIEGELRSPQPDKERVASRMESLTQMLKEAGALAAAGTALVGPLGVLAGFLGPLGHVVANLVRD
jgi:hypothetical protein